MTWEIVQSEQKPVKNTDRIGKRTLPIKRTPVYTGAGEQSQCDIRKQASDTASHTL